MFTILCTIVQFQDVGSAPGVPDYCHSVCPGHSLPEHWDTSKPWQDCQCGGFFCRHNWNTKNRDKYVYIHTVGIRKPDKSGFQMVDFRKNWASGSRTIWNPTLWNRTTIKPALVHLITSQGLVLSKKIWVLRKFLTNSENLISTNFSSKSEKICDKFFCCC